MTIRARDDPLARAEAGASAPLRAAQASYGAHDHPSRAHSHSIAALWKAGYKRGDELSRVASRPVREFYERQNALLQRFRAVSDGAAVGPAEAPHAARVRRAIVASNVCNAFLMLCQLYAFFSSGALALLAVFVDAVLDMVSGLVVSYTWYMKRKRDKHRYPVGRSRLEPLGVIGMACLMTAATLLTLERSVSTLVTGQHDSFTGLTYVSATVLVAALVVKGSLYSYCHVVDDMSVQALAEDHFNDCLANTVSLATVLVAQHAAWWVDPLGGICISCLIIRNWVLHTLEHFDQLLGRVADRDVLSVITFVACNHSPHIRLVDTVRAYHVGNGIYAEVDIALSADMPLREAHDVGESLQVRIETLDGIERCFVHLDFETDHSPSIEHKEI